MQHVRTPRLRDSAYIYKPDAVTSGKVDTTICCGTPQCSFGFTPLKTHTQTHHTRHSLCVHLLSMCDQRYGSNIVGVAEIAATALDAAIQTGKGRQTLGFLKTYVAIVVQHLANKCPHISPTIFREMTGVNIDPTRMPHRTKVKVILAVALYGKGDIFVLDTVLREMVDHLVETYTRRAEQKGMSSENASRSAQHKVLQSVFGKSVTAYIF